MARECTRNAEVEFVEQYQEVVVRVGIQLDVNKVNVPLALVSGIGMLEDHVII
jgi:hypothetical protein